MLTKISLSSVIHRETSLTRKLEKQHSPGSVGTFLALVLALLLWMLWDQNWIWWVLRKWYCGQRMEGVANIIIVAIPCMPNLTVFSSKIIFWEQGPLMRVDTMVPLWRIFNWEFTSIRSLHHHQSTCWLVLYLNRGTSKTFFDSGMSFFLGPERLMHAIRNYWFLFTCFYMAVWPQDILSVGN